MGDISPYREVNVSRFSSETPPSVLQLRLQENIDRYLFFFLNNFVCKCFLKESLNLLFCIQLLNTVNFFRFFASEPKTYSDGSDDSNKNEKLLSGDCSQISSSGSGNGSGKKYFHN